MNFLSEFRRYFSGSAIRRKTRKGVEGAEIQTPQASRDISLPIILGPSRMGRELGDLGSVVICPSGVRGEAGDEIEFNAF